MAKRKTSTEKPVTKSLDETAPAEELVEAVEPQVRAGLAEPDEAAFFGGADLASAATNFDPLIEDDDDLIMLKASDSKLDEADSYGIFKQDEGVVSWTITNFIDAEGKQYSKRELRANPPVLTFESSTGEKADFVLSKEFSGSLASIIERVYYGYYGLDRKPKKKFTLETVKQSVLSAIGARPLQVGAFVLLTIVVIVGLVTG